MKEKVKLTSGLPFMLPIIKIVGDWCNLKCDYCFYYNENQQKRTIMPYSLLEKFIKEYLSLFDGNLKFTWHGGEPLLAGVDFFERIVRYQEDNINENQKILNTVQTNGTLIDEKWAEFFRKNDFRIGVSLDGIEECHNIFRKDSQGKGTFRKVIRGIKLLQEYEVPVGILHVVTRTSLSFAKENLDFFFNELGVKKISSLIYSHSGNPLLEKEELKDDNLEYFYQELIDYWLEENNPDFRSREIDNFVAGAIERQANLCSFGGTCTGFFCLERNGEIYPCDRFSWNKDFCWGDLSQKSLLEILNSSKRMEYVRRINSLPIECIGCKWTNACHNGCPILRNGKGKYQFCEVRKKIFDYLSEIINKEKIQRTI
jgi:uncharacterized protein